MTTKECKPIDWALVDGIVKREKSLNFKIIYAICFYTGYRVGDILKANWENVVDEKGIVYKSYMTNEQKTGKVRVIKYSDNCRKYIQKIYNDKGRPDRSQPLIICSRGTRKGARMKLNGLIKVFKKKMVRDHKLDPAEQNTTHLMRKTWAYKMYLDLCEHVTPIEALVKVQRLLNHGDINHTVIYLGIDYSGVDEILMNL